MKNSNIKSYEELPCFLNAEVLAKVLGISISSSYELMNKRNFPSIRIGKRLVVQKDRFVRWADEQSERGKK